MIIHQNTGQNDADAKAIKRRMLMAYVNLSGIYFKTENYKNSKQACDFALEIDCNSIHAL